MLDCVVVGAGIAGLIGALELTRRGKDVVVLEARDRVGGRVESMILPGGRVLELGAQWVAPAHDRMLGLIEAADLELVGASEGELVVRMQGKVSHIPEDDAGPDLSPFDVADLGQGLLRFRRLSERVRHDDAWVAANRAWLSQSVDRWVSANLRTQGGQSGFKDAFERAFDGSIARLTLKEGLDRAVSGMDLEELIFVNGGLNLSRVDGGMSLLCEHLGDNLGDVLRLGTPVVRLEQDQESVRVISAAGQMWQARTALVTLPPWLAHELEYDPAMPSWRAEAVSKVSRGNVVKACLVYQTPWWLEQGLSGQMGTDEGAVRVTFDTTERVAGGHGMLMGMFEGDSSAELIQGTAEQRRQAFTDSVVSAFGELAAHPIAYYERDWGKEPWSMGSHSPHFAPGAWTVTGSQLAETEGRILFAGAEFASKFNGYLEGAVRSAIDAVGDILRERPS